MSARIIDGKAIAAELRVKIAAEVKRLSAQHGVTPGLAVVLAGNNPASESYVGSKAKATKEAGMMSFDHRLPDNVSQAELMALVKKLNADPAVHGILVQLPLPQQIDAQQVLDAVDPTKDVDGFHPVNAGRLASGLPALVPTSTTARPGTTLCALARRATSAATLARVCAAISLPSMMAAVMLLLPRSCAEFSVAAAQNTLG